MTTSSPTPNKPPVEGFKPRQLDQGWGAVLEGERVAQLPDERPAARYAHHRHRQKGRLLDRDPQAGHQQKRHRDRRHQYRPAAQLMTHRESLERRRLVARQETRLGYGLRGWVRESGSARARRGRYHDGYVFPRV